MPKSKRDKKVSLTKTTKKGKSLKEKLINNIRRDLEEFDNLYVFTVHNMRNAPLKEVREDWKGSRFVFAKKRIMALALGRNEASEGQKNVHKLAKHLIGQCGLLFTNKPKDYVLEWFRNFSTMDYAKSGFVATRTVTLPAGPLPDFSHAIEPHLRSLGLPTSLEKGIIVLREDHTVCREGVKLKPEEASVLKLIGDQMAEFKISLVCMWSKDGSFEKFKAPKYITKMTRSVIDIDSSKQNKKKQKKHKRLGYEKDHGNIKHQVATGEELIRPMTSLSTSEPQQFSDQEMENTEEKTKTQKSKKKIKTKRLELISETQVSDKDVEIFQEQVETLKKVKSTEESAELLDETPMDMNEDQNNPTLNMSPGFGKNNPRRSLRLRKPNKRTPEHLKHSVNKLSVTATKVQKSTPRGTPKKSKV